jgi:multiple sugar transport system permease protein
MPILKKYLTLSLNYIYLLIMLLFFAGPLVWLLLTSFKLPKEVFLPTLPSKLTVMNYAGVFKDYEIHKFYWNSVSVTLVSTIVPTFLGTIAAYAYNRFQFFLKQQSFIMVLLIRIFPPVVLLLPLYLMFSRWGILDTKLALMLGYIPINIPLVIWIMEGFFRELPRELEEAASIDGSGRFRTLIRIVIPLATPGIAVSALFCFLTAWKEFFFALIVTSSPKSQTLPILLTFMVLRYGIRWDYMAAAGILYIIPIIFAAIFMQKYLIRGLTYGAVKG